LLPCRLLSGLPRLRLLEWPTPQEVATENGAALYVLEGASAQALERARMNKGSRKSWCLMKNVELTDLIERLEHGERVTLEEIEDAVDGLLGPELDQPVAFAGCH
jgi:hypothetical protein